jgi:hypothetical protein
MVSYRIIAVLALTAAGVIAAPCEAGNGNGNGASATGVANAQNAQATGAAGNAQGGNSGNAGGNAAACNPANVGDAQGPGNVGKDGAQFVTGVCTSDANCASNCCVLGGGKDPNVAVCRNEPALKAGEACGFSCAA